MCLTQDERGDAFKAGQINSVTPYVVSVRLLMSQTFSISQLQLPSPQVYSDTAAAAAGANSLPLPDTVANLLQAM